VHGDPRLTPGRPPVYRAWIHQLRLVYDGLLSSSTFNFNLRPSSPVTAPRRRTPPRALPTQLAPHRAPWRLWRRARWRRRGESGAAIKMSTGASASLSRGSRTPPRQGSLGRTAVPRAGFPARLLLGTFRREQFRTLWKCATRVVDAVIPAASGESGDNWQASCDSA